MQTSSNEAISKKRISIVTPTFNESENVDILYRRIKLALVPLAKYEFEIIFIDNKSTDDTVAKIKRIAFTDSSVKLIVNARNFGHIRSPYYGIMQAQGEAVIYLASDLQDPPEMIDSFIQQWEAGFKVVLGTKPTSTGFWLDKLMRRIYYVLLDSMSDVSITRNATGFGLYDQIVVRQLREINDPYPYLRGLVSELGYLTQTIDFHQPKRFKGLTKNNWYSLYDIGMLGFVSHSKVPLRLAVISGFFSGAVSLLLAAYFVARKLLDWDSFQLGMSPILVGLFFFGGMQLIFLGILGEYVGVILNYSKKRPVVVEEERVNF